MRNSLFRRRQLSHIKGPPPQAKSQSLSGAAQRQHLPQSCERRCHPRCDRELVRAGERSDLRMFQTPDPDLRFSDRSARCPRLRSLAVAACHLDAARSGSTGPRPSSRGNGAPSGNGNATSVPAAPVTAKANSAAQPAGSTPPSAQAGGQNAPVAENAPAPANPIPDRKSAARALGWFAIAFSTLLGAPFWFGILSKVSNVRGAGDAADEKKDTPVPAQAAASAPQGGTATASAGPPRPDDPGRSA
jgi:hypothetical protein